MFSNVNLKIILFSLASTLTFIGMQNCGRVNVTETFETDAFLSSSLRFNEITVVVDVNQSKTIDLLNEAQFSGSFSFAENELLEKLELSNEGDVTLSPDKKGELTFNPKIGYRGLTSANVFIRNLTSQEIEVLKVNFRVQNPLVDLDPSLALRAAECILCHARIKGDVVSDFGYKSDLDPFGKDFFLAERGDTGNTLSFAPFHSKGNLRNAGWSTAIIDGDIYVPKVVFDDLPDSKERLFLITREYVENSVTKVAQTLKEYMEKIVMPYKPSGVSVDRVKDVYELDKVYIGAPTQDDIIQAGGLTTSEPLKFIKNNDDSPDLSGFIHFQENGKDYYTNASDEAMVCEGDLFVDGVVWLNDLKIQTENGCRLYVTRSVFIHGAIDYIDESALTNLQITSATLIYMGAGICIDCHTGSDGEYGANWVDRRVNGMVAWVEELRGFEDMAAYRAGVNEDFLKVSNVNPIPPRPADSVTDKDSYYQSQLSDAGITMLDPKASVWNHSETGYHRLLLNAPAVHSRYNGDFQGWVIAEFALWKLGDFKFRFDPVFKSVPILPLINFDKVLKLER
ncbi:MAG: hypothetical protein HRT44_08820 [Bdellovibrionales bacterium]|nr:hypothetical protein [Bdellovibrionales bacterium]